MDAATLVRNPSPFPSEFTRDTFFESVGHEEALARLHFLVERRRHFGLVLGGVGSGKTFLLRFFEQLITTGEKASLYVNLAGQSKGDVLRQLADGLGLFPSPAAAEHELLRGVLDRIAENGYQQRDTLLLLDDLDDAEEETLRLVWQLASIALGSQPRLMLIAAANAGRIRRLPHRLVDLVELKIEIDPWAGDDILAYLERGLSACGASAEVFEPEALQRIEQLSGGVPRLVNQLADLCLLAAAAQDSDRVDPEIVDTVFDELQITTAGD